MNIKTYASGDGALHFTSLQEDGKCGPTPTHEQCCDHLASSEDAKHLRQDGWRIAVINGQTVCVAPVKRLDANTIQVKDEIYHLELDPSYVYANGEVGDQGMHLTFDLIDEETNKPFGNFELKNWSTRSSIRYFLTHEKELAKQPWTEIPFVFAGQGI